MIKQTMMAAAALALCTSLTWAQEDAAKKAKPAGGGGSGGEAAKEVQKAVGKELQLEYENAEGAKCMGGGRGAKCLSATLSDEAQGAAEGAAKECADYKKLRYSKAEEVEEAVAKKLAAQKAMAKEEDWGKLDEAEKALAKKLAVLYGAEAAAEKRMEEARNASGDEAKEIKRKACGAQKKLKKAIAKEITDCEKAKAAGKAYKNVKCGKKP